MRDLGLSTLQSKPVCGRHLKVGFHSRVILTCRTCVNFTHVNKIEAMYERLRIDVKVERGFNFGVYAQPFIHCLYFIYIRKNYARVEIYPPTKHCIKASDTRKGNLFISWNSLRDSLREGIKNDREINHFLPTSKLFCLKMFCERKKYKRFEGYCCNK